MNNKRTKKMNNKTTAILSALAAIAAATLCATPSSNTVEAVTQDWKQGNYSNVYELAQARFASNSNDLVAAHLMMEFDTAFSSREAASNSIMRLVRISDEVTLPAYTNLYGMARSSWIWYANEFFPSLTDTELEQHHIWAQTTRHEMSSDFMLEILWKNNLW